MTITAGDIAALRARTGMGIMDCKKALEETNGNAEQAIENLRKSGAIKAAKRAGKIAAEGLVLSYIHGMGKIGVLVEVNVALGALPNLAARFAERAICLTLSCMLGLE